MDKFNTGNASGQQPNAEGPGLDQKDPDPMEQTLGRLDQEVDLEASARSSGALVRHRGIRRAKDLLRIVLAYGVLDYSLNLLGMWSVMLGLANISKTALLKRLRKCQPWLGELVVWVLMQHKLLFPAPARLRVKLIDASVITQPGSQGADWRLHLGFNLQQSCMDWIQITDGKGSESLTRFEFGPGDLCIVDRGYALMSSIGYALTQEAWLIARIGWFRQPGLKHADGSRFDIVDWLKKSSLPAGDQPTVTDVWLFTASQQYPLRLIAQPLPQQAAEEARRRLRKEAKKKGRTVQQNSLFAAGFMLLITNLPPLDWDTLQVLDLYRFRWQIELAFKRLKSLTGIDNLRIKDPQLAQTYLSAKILAALLVDNFLLQVQARFPEWFVSLEHPLSLWRLTALYWEQVRDIVRGQITLDQFWAAFPKLRRFLCDAPRKRTSQRAHAQVIFSRL
jgi:hypothetical protein